MSGDQELPSLLPVLEQSGSIIHTVTFTPISVLLGSQTQLLFTPLLPLAPTH